MQQNKVNHGPTRALAFSTNEGVSRRSGERVQVLACSRQPVIHRACSQTSFRSWFRQISGEPPPPPWLRVRVDVPVRPFVCVRLLFQALLHFESCALLLPLAKETPVDLTASLMRPNKIVFADLPSDVRCCLLRPATAEAPVLL